MSLRRRYKERITIRFLAVSSDQHRMSPSPGLFPPPPFASSTNDPYSKPLEEDGDGDWEHGAGI